MPTLFCAQTAPNQSEVRAKSDEQRMHHNTTSLGILLIQRNADNSLQINMMCLSQLHYH